MSISPFVAPFDSLPNTLPIFPLPDAIVMPGSELPLNIFEPRYLNMINDALGSHRMIGMIQPDAEVEGGVYRTGCAGRITQYRETGDGRIEMVLGGVCRFDVVEELATTRGYRLVQPDWSRYADDYVDYSQRLEDYRERLMKMLVGHFDAKGFEADLEMLKRLPVVRLIDSLTMVLPFDGQEKQMLLETVDAEQRLQNFIALIDGEFIIPDSATRH